MSVVDFSQVRVLLFFNVIRQYKWFATIYSALHKMESVRVYEINAEKKMHNAIYCYRSGESAESP